MEVLNYIAAQKAMLRARHSGEEFYYQSAREKNSPVKAESLRRSEDILREMDGLKGLNVEGRRYYASYCGGSGKAAAAATAAAAKRI